MTKERSCRVVKKLLVFFVVFMTLFSANAEMMGLESMSTEELLSLKARINSILIERTDIWKEVRVPKGIWEVGVHIPAGHWTICFDDPDCDYYVDVTIGSEYAETAFGYRVVGERELYMLSNKSRTSFSHSIYEIDLILTEGQFVEIDRDYVLFTPYGAIRDLGFDW